MKPTALRIVDAADAGRNRAPETQALAHAAVVRYRNRQAEPPEPLVPTRAGEVPDSYVWERGFLGFLRKRPTVNTRMRALPKAVGEE